MPKTTIKQHDITDCGAACLASVAAHYKLQLPIARIRQYASTDKKGTNMFGMVEAAEKLGFEAKGVKGITESLSKIPLPAIAHVVVKEVLHHYVVIYKVTKTHITLMNPADGKMHKKPIAAFETEWTGVLMLLLPSQEFTPKNEKVSVYKRFWFLLKPHKFVLFQAFVGAVVFTLLGFSISIYIQKLTDFVLVGGNTKLLNLLSVVVLALLVAQIIIGVFKDTFIVKTGQQIDARLILGYYKHLLKLPQPFFDTMRVGEIISRIGDAVKIRTFINNVSLNLAVNVLILVFSFAIMFSYYWKLALIMSLVIPLYALVYFIVNRLNKKTERKIMERAADLESQLVESLQAVSTIKHFALEYFANTKTEVRFISLLKSGYKSALNSIFSTNSSQAIAQVFTVVLLWSGSYYAIDGEITIGELMSFYAIIGYFTNPVASLIGANVQIQNALIAADRLFEIMDLQREKETDKIRLTEEKIGDIRYENVSFRYGSRVDVFKKLNLVIPKGSVTALVGESGSGKSTIISLLLKIYTIQKGKISIGDIDLNHIETDSLREIIGVVPQKVDLFSGNVIDNIAIGELAPNMERVLEVCKSLQILSFIESLPNGFQTYLGENGANLSGGQKQKIAIARALYKNPEIIVFDEATSSLDSLAQQDIWRAIQSLKNQNKTIVISTHRLQSICNATKIVVLKQGKLVEEGTHKELLKAKKTYYTLWKNQTALIDG